jgi:hypothetical protein
MLNEFLNKIQGEQQLCFTDTLDNVYSALIDKLKQEFPKLNQYTLSSLNDDSPPGVAYQFYKYFPTHFFKFFQALVITEQESLETGITNVLNWSSVTFVDIGCGAGAGSIALLFFLERYQQFLIDNNKPISPIRVFLIGFDPSENMISLYRRVVEEYIPKLSPLLIHVEYKTLIEPFPQGVEQLICICQPNNPHSVLLGISNVIRPLWDSFNTGETIWEERKNQALRGEMPSAPEFGAAEARAIKSILEDWKIARTSLLSIATIDNKNLWHEKLDSMAHVIRNRISPHSSHGTRIKKQTVKFVNPRDSYFGYNSNGYPANYYLECSNFIHESYEKDKQWQSILEIDNIKLAWARSRRYSLHEVLADEAEILLFDYEVEMKLDRLRKKIFAHEWKALNVEHTLFFDAPKKPGSPRPKTITRLEEQILSAALIQCSEIEKPNREASYSYHLNEKMDEFLYDSWLDRWKEFIEQTHQLAKSRDILRSDIKGCYQNINQSQLIDVVKRNFNIEVRTEQLLNKLLCRDCNSQYHKPGAGIPQGHIASGFWADLFLAQFDNNYFTQEPKLSGVKFARYADDFVFAVDSKLTDSDKVKSKLQESLKSLNLEISEDKTFPQDGDEYISETTLDKELDKIGKRFDRIVKKIYKINNQYQNLYKQNEWGFVSSYNRLLKLLRIYESEQWLSRKLYQYTSLTQLNWIIKPPNWLKIGIDWFKSWLNWLKHQELNFPLFPDSLETEQDWLQEFYEQNANWTKELEQLRTDLVELCQTSIKILSPEGNPEQIWQIILGNIQMPFTQGLLREHGKLIAYDGQQACIAIKTEPLLKIAHDKLPEIKAAFEKTLNKKVEVKLEVASTIDQNSTNSQGSVPSLETDKSTPTITEAEIKKAKRRLKFSANRLCTLGLDEVADLLATEIIQRPWQVSVHLLCRGLSKCGRADLLIKIFDSSDDAYVKSLAIRALAEVQPHPPTGGIERMWAMLQSNSAKPYEKLKASEALLFAEQWKKADVTNCQQLIEQEKDPYLLKNYVLIIGRAGGNNIRGYLEDLQAESFESYVQCLEGDCSDEKCHNLIVIDAIQYVLRSLDRDSQGQNEDTANKNEGSVIGQKECSLVYRNEPKLLRHYYSKNYPVTESETMVGSNSSR